MVPQDGIGGCVPRPRKLSVASIRIAVDSANVVWTMGNHQLIYQHQDAKDGARNDLTSAQPSCKNDSIGWQYNFSRRTFALLEYSKVENNDTGTCNFGSTPGPLTTAIAGQDIKALQFGISHSF